MTVTVYDDAGHPTEIVTAQEGRRHHHRRRHRARLRRRGPHRERGARRGEFGELMTWADAVRTHEGPRQRRHPARRAHRARLRRRGHRPLPHRAHVLRRGAHRRPMREMILADDVARPRGARSRSSCPFQREDFVGIFREMAGLPVTIRLLDPPLHEFLPDRAEAARAARRSRWACPCRSSAQRTKDLHEFNPMLGHRGCRLAITFPEIYAMQVRAILEAAAQVAARGRRGAPRDHDPARHDAGRARAHARRSSTRSPTRSSASAARRVAVLVRHDDRAAARGASSPASSRRSAEFFSFGTNDLTQATHGPLARRRRQVPAGVRRGGHPAEGSVRVDRRRRASARS